MRPSDVRFSIRRLMLVLAMIALAFGALRFFYSMLSFHPPFYVRDQDVIAGICRVEADFMESRRITCLKRAKANAPWDALDDQTEDLKIHPFPSDDAPCSSWSEQAAVWGRASAKCAKAAKRLGRPWWNSLLRIDLSGVRAD